MISLSERENEIVRKYEFMAITSMDGYWILDACGHILFANKALIEMSGYSYDDLIGKHLRDIEALEDEATLRQHLACIKVKGYDRFDSRLFHKDGHRTDVEVSVSFFPEDDIFLAFIRDITPQKVYLTLLRESEERYRALFQNSIDAIFLAESDGEISAANPAACAMFGMTEEELSQAGRAGIVNPDDPRLTAALEERTDLGKVRCELTFVRKDGSKFPAEVTSILLDNSYHSFVILRDISDLKSAQEEIMVLNSELEMRIKERTIELESAVHEQEAFSYSVSHDLRAPLRHINSFSAMLMEDFGATIPDKARNYLERIIGSTRKMGLLIDDLLQLSRINRTGVNPERIDLSTMAKSVASMLQESEPQRCGEFFIEDGLLVHGDCNLLNQLLENLLGNAWKYSSGKAFACINVGKICVDGRQAFFVKDNGVGFDMAYSDNLFKIFQRLHGAEFEGTGIGLATAKRIIERHRGDIWAEGRVDAGATFYFALPEHY